MLSKKINMGKIVKKENTISSNHNNILLDNIFFNRFSIGCELKRFPIENKKIFFDNIHDKISIYFEAV